MTSGPTTQKDGWRVLLTSCPAPPTPKWRNDAVIARCASSGAGIGRDRIPGRRGLCRASRGPLGPAAGVLHIGEGHPRDSMTGFPHDSAVRPRMSVLSGEAPMCRGDRSAHGRASTALSAGAFPHDSANPPPAGPARMCNTARPGPTPHIQVWPRSPRTHFWHRPGPARPGRTSGIASDLTPHHPLRADPPPLNHILMRKTHSVAGSPDSGPSSFASAYSSRTRTSHLRARGESGESRRDPGTGETPGTGLGAEILPRLRSRGLGGVMGIDTGTDMVVRALPRARRGHRGERQARRGYPGGRRTRCPTRGRPPRPTRGRWLSKSATKTPTEPERTRRNVDIPRLRSPSIPPQGAFVADSDTPPPRVATGAAPAPSFQRPAATNPSKEQRRLASGSPFLIIRVHRPE